MKNLLFLAISVFICGYQANAENQVSVREADMKLISARGVFDKVKSVLLTENKGLQNTEFFINIDGQVTQLVIEDVKTSNCGATNYLLKQKIRHTNDANLLVSLTDYTSVVCGDMKKNIWEAQVNRESRGNPDPLSEMRMVGAPFIITGL